MQVLDCHAGCDNIHIHLSVLLYCLFFLSPTTVFIYLSFQVPVLSQHYMDLPIIFLTIYYLSCPCHHIHLSIFFFSTIYSLLSSAPYESICNFFLLSTTYPGLVTICIYPSFFFLLYNISCRRRPSRAWRCSARPAPWLAAFTRSGASVRRLPGSSPSRTLVGMLCSGSKALFVPAAVAETWILKWLRIPFVIGSTFFHINYFGYVRF